MYYKKSIPLAIYVINHAIEKGLDIELSPIRLQFIIYCFEREFFEKHSKTYLEEVFLRDDEGLKIKDLDLFLSNKENLHQKHSFFIKEEKNDEDGGIVFKRESFNPKYIPDPVKRSLKAYLYKSMSLYDWDMVELIEKDLGLIADLQRTGKGDVFIFNKHYKLIRAIKEQISNDRDVLVNSIYVKDYYKKVLIVGVSKPIDIEKEKNFLDKRTIAVSYKHKKGKNLYLSMLNNDFFYHDKYSFNGTLVLLRGLLSKNIIALPKDDFTKLEYNEESYNKERVYKPYNPITNEIINNYYLVIDPIGNNILDVVAGKRTLLEINKLNKDLNFIEVSHELFSCKDLIGELNTIDIEFFGEVKSLDEVFNMEVEE